MKLKINTLFKYLISRINFFSVLIFFCFIVQIYIFYRSEFYWRGSIRTYYLKYQLIFLILIVFFIFLTFLKSNVKRYILIIFSSIAFSLFFFEGFLIYQKNYYKKKPYDKRTLFEVYEDLNKNGKRFVTYRAPSGHIQKHFKETNLYTFSGVSNSQTILCNENGYYSIYQSDRYGFNNPEEEWNSKNIEYFLIGDSFVHGMCVNRPDDIASVLRKISLKNVLNLGVAGLGPIQEYAVLREYIKPNINKILWFYFEGNDLDQIRSGMNNNILMKYLMDINFKQNLTLKQDQIDKSLLKAIDEYYFYKISKENKFQELLFIKFIKLFELRGLLKESFKSKLAPDFSVFKNIISLANDLAVKNNSKFYFIYLPDYNRYKLKSKSKDLELMYNKNKIKKIVDELGIKFIDIDEEVFKKEQNPLILFPFEKMGHYNVQGYKKIAEKIHEKTK